MSKDKIQKIRSGFFDRSLSMTKVAVRSSASFAANHIRNFWSEEGVKSNSFHAMLEAQAKLLANELGRLKGSLMKMGQMLALYGEHFFPEEVVNVLQALNEDSPPLDWQSLEPILNRRLTAAQLAQLTIDPEALAAASMGQVHKARIKKTNETVCIKVQYPGVSQAIDNDVRTLKSILSMLRLIPTHKAGFDEMMTEIKAMLRQEVDYGREIKFTDQMAELLADDPRFVVPKTFPDFSGPKILTTSFEAGFGIASPQAANLSGTQRNHLGEAFAELLIRELFEFHLVQTDPHFGNYKIRLDEANQEPRIILLDFGAVRKFSKKFVSGYRKMVVGALLGDDELTLDGARRIGFLMDGDGQRLTQCFLKIAYAAVEPFLAPNDPRRLPENYDQHGHYKWDESRLPNRITELATEYALTFKLRPPPREVIFLDRKLGGMFIILHKLGARFDAYTLVKRMLLDESSSS